MAGPDALASMPKQHRQPASGRDVALRLSTVGVSPLSTRSARMWRAPDAADAHRTWRLQCERAHMTRRLCWQWRAYARATLSTPTGVSDSLLLRYSHSRARSSPHAAALPYTPVHSPARELSRILGDDDVDNLLESGAVLGSAVDDALAAPELERSEPLARTGALPFGRLHRRRRRHSLRLPDCKHSAASTSRRGRLRVRPPPLLDWKGVAAAGRLARRLRLALDCSGGTGRSWSRHLPRGARRRC